MRRTASEVLNDLEMRVARLERQASTLRSAKKDESLVANSIARVTASLLKDPHSNIAFEEAQVDTDESTNLIEVSQLMLFSLTEAQFGSRLRETDAYYRSFDRLPRSKAFKKTLAEAILNEARDKSIHIPSKAEKYLGVNYRKLAEDHTFTGEVSFYGSDLEVEEVSLRRGNFSITVIYKQYFKPAEARGEDMESYMRDDYNY